MSITFNHENLKGFVEKKDFESIWPQVQKAHDLLGAKSGAGKESLGWMDLPSRISDGFIKDLEKLAGEIQQNSDALISIGIGGSYLGIRATVEFLSEKTKLPIHCAGHNLSSDYLFNLLEELKDKRLMVVVISKSGTTTEPAVAFRIIKEFLQKKYKEPELEKRIVCVTDEKKGALKRIADEQGYRTFVIPDDVGGRFSVLTPVGLVPLAMAGVDIKGMVEGARKAQAEYSKMDFEKNAAYQYAAARNLLYKKGKVIEVLSSFYPNMFSIAEWWKQLFGESEGKNGKGIFPASLILTTDLHSMGQWMQEGARNIFETFLMIDKPSHQVMIPKEDEDLDGFNCVAAKELDFVNKQAYRATAMAHREGGVPNMTIGVCRVDSFHAGELYYFFEKAVAVSGYLLGVNPFDQPGVEAYKTKLFALLGKR